MSVMLMLRPSLIICLMAGTPSAVAGILTMRLGSVDALVERPCRVDGAGGVGGQGRRDLDRDEAVVAAALVVHRAQHAERVGDVVDHHAPVGVLDASCVAEQLGELLVVVGAAADGLLEDRRVRGHAPDAVRRPARCELAVVGTRA